MIYALVKCYQSEKHGLAKCLKSLEGVDSIILCDGRYPDSAWGTMDPKQLAYYQHRYPLGNESTDNSKEIGRGFSNALWLRPPRDGWKSETEKMIYMLSHVPDDSWVLLIDPDERLVGNIRSCFPPHPTDVIAMRVTDPKGQSIYYNRLFRKSKGVAFDSHHSLKFPAGASVELYLGNAPATCFIRHERIEVDWVDGKPVS